MDIFGETSAGGFKAGRAADMLVIRTLREGLFAAVIAIAAWNVVEDHDAVADGEVADAISHGGDCASGFMSEDTWSGMRTRVNFLEVGAADAASGDANEDLTRSDGWNRYGFDTDIVDAAIDSGAHGGRNRVSGDFRIRAVRGGHLLSIVYRDARERFRE